MYTYKFILQTDAYFSPLHVCVFQLTFRVWYSYLTFEFLGFSLKFLPLLQRQLFLCFLRVCVCVCVCMYVCVCVCVCV